MNIEELITALEETANPVQQTINNIIKEHTKGLDIVVNRIERTLYQLEQGQIQEYPIRQLELDFTRLTTEIYRVNAVLAELGGTSDIAKSKREIEFSKAYLRNKGNTIKEKEALANIEVKNDIIIEKAYDRIIRQLKLTTENADNIHMALKRIHTAKLTELEVFRGEELKGGKYVD